MKTQEQIISELTGSPYASETGTTYLKTGISEYNTHLYPWLSPTGDITTMFSPEVNDNFLLCAQDNSIISARTWQTNTVDLHNVNLRATTSQL
jgi:hypothetical protein